MAEQWVTDFAAQCVLRMNESTERVTKCLSMLPEDKLWQRPNSQLSSVGNLVLHLCGNITQYIISSLGGAADTRIRNTEFETTGGYTRQELMTMMVATATQACGVINNCSAHELMRMRTVQGFALTGIGICIHVVEHYSYHTGQIALHTKLMLEKDLGFYAGLNLDITNE
jgi:uncharacterized damage-inducible protein DinB